MEVALVCDILAKFLLLVIATLSFADLEVSFCKHEFFHQRTHGPIKLDARISITGHVELLMPSMKRKSSYFDRNLDGFFSLIIHEQLGLFMYNKSINISECNIFPRESLLTSSPIVHVNGKL